MFVSFRMSAVSIIDMPGRVSGAGGSVADRWHCRYGIQPSNVDAGAGIILKKDVDRVVGLTKQGYR